MNLSLKAKVANFIGTLSVMRERHNQIKRVKQQGLSRAADITVREASLILTQDCPEEPPVAIVATLEGQIVARFECLELSRSKKTNQVTCELSSDRLEVAYERASAIYADKQKQNNEDPPPAPESFILPLAWVFNPQPKSVKSHKHTSFISNGWMIPADKVEPALKLSVQEAGAKLEHTLWAGNAHSVQKNSLGYVHGDFGAAHIRGNRFNRFVLAIGSPEPARVAAFADAIVAQRNLISIRGRLTEIMGVIGSAEFVWRSNATGVEFSTPISLELDSRWSKSDAGRRTWQFKAETEIKESRWNELLTSDYFDAYVRVNDAVTGDVLDQRLSRVPFLARFFHTNSEVKIGRARLSIVPYFTFKAKALSVRIEHYPELTKDYFHLKAFNVARLRKSQDRPARVWLIGELPYKAQDNGMHFYNWMRKYHPEIDVYYVISKDSPERRNLEDTTHIVDFGSERHFELALLAQKFIGSHSPDYLYPTRSPSYVKHLRGARVFLQHGVMAAKWTVPLYGKKAPGFKTDLFLVSSEYEKSYIVSDYGYDPSEVKVTGLSRFDVLLQPNSSVEPGTLLIMPTWRDWLQGVKDFTQSDYYLKWSSLLSSEQFKNLLAERGLSVTLCLHPNMQRFSHFFEGLPGRIVYQSEVDVQTLLMKSACMITDYSSVAMDFSFQDRPVIFYHFDRKRFYRDGGTHIDLDAELPGQICFSEQEVVESLHELSDLQFKQPDEMRARARKFLDNRDTYNSQRIFEAISAVENNARHYSLPGMAEAGSVFYNWFRRSSFYYPVMKTMYRVGRSLPRIKGLTIFESHHGKQYSDSPRYIYEELVRQRPDMQKAWIMNNTRTRFKDSNTVVIKRLSPKYFWMMARAQTWVLNQSAPYYLVRPKQTNYIQTWHGTPLKKMQHDANLSAGRDAGYLDRALRATSQWSTLLSPSPYATRAFRSAFKYKSEVAELGYPRNDVLVASDRGAKAALIKRSMSIRENKRVVLYAPTFRDDQFSNNGKFSFEVPFDFHRFAEKIPNDVLLLLRLHSQVARDLEIPSELQDRIRDVSKVDEIQELLLISDVLVTDYSSILFDAAILRRPIVLYAYDLDHYRDTLRGMYLNYEASVPGVVVRDEESFLAAIADALETPIDIREREEFIRRFNPRDDGNASKRVVNELVLKRGESMNRIPLYPKD